jgi:hypothetical protein
MYRHVERQAKRMNEVIERLDVDPMMLVRQRSGEAFAEARLACIRCSRVSECLAWLDNGGDVRSVQEFCPNAPLFASCRRKAS